MKKHNELYIDGSWVSPLSNNYDEIINPATGRVCARTPLAGEADVNAAIAAARAAFPAWSQTSASRRAAFINATADEMEKRSDDLISAISQTMGCPLHLTDDLQVEGSIQAFRSFAKLAHLMDEVEEKEGFIILREAVGVCTLINPWNYPLSQLAGKIGAALAAGCTMVVKPAEQTPLQDYIVAEVFDKIGLPSGVFNLTSGVGADLGKVLCGHPEVDMVSFTGSSIAGVKISNAAAPSIKRVCLELGGKSPYIITADADLTAAVRYGVEDVMINTGQTCTALTRMLVPQACYEEVLTIAKTVAEENVVGDPQNPLTTMGPVSSKKQKNTVLNYIEKGLAEGARLITGGIEMPEGLQEGAYVKPTIFADVRNNMSIAREEIFGPVLCIMGYTDIDQAVEIANDSVYGLSSAVYAKDKTSAMKIARRLRTGQCYLQGSSFKNEAPFGGYKQSGNGREWGEEGLKEYVEIKSVICE
jgi:aldehyde dehydrogenase (NAD+)